MARLVLSALALVMLLAAAAPARADDPPPRARRADAPVVRLGEIVVPGWIHDPGVVFVLERSRPRFTPTPLNRSFIPDLLRSTRGL